MSNPKPQAVQTPFQQQQSQNNTYSYMSPLAAGSPGVSDFLNTPLNFGDPNAYGGEAYKDIKNDFKFDIDPGVGRRTDLAEQGFQNQSNSAFNAGMPQEYRQLQRDSGLQQIRSQGAAEAQQARYAQQNAQQQADYQSSLARAGMRDQGELARANMANNIAGQTTAAELDRRRLLLPQLVQTGGSSSGSGYNSQVVQPQPGFLSSLAQGAGAALIGKI